MRVKRMSDRRVSLGFLRSGKGSADHQGDKSDDGFLVGGGVGGGTGGGVSVDSFDRLSSLLLLLLLSFIVCAVLVSIYRIKKIKKRKVGVTIHVKKQMGSFIYYACVYKSMLCVSWRNCKVAGVISDPQTLSHTHVHTQPVSTIIQHLFSCRTTPHKKSTPYYYIISLTPPTFAPLSSLGDFSFLSYPSSLMLISHMKTKLTLCVRIHGTHNDHTVIIIPCIISFPSSSSYALSKLYVYVLLISIRTYMALTTTGSYPFGWSATSSLGSNNIQPALEHYFDWIRGGM